MGLLSWLLKKKKKPIKFKEKGEKELKEENIIYSGIKEQTISLNKLETPEQQVFSPPVEHPLLTIQDRISKLEALYRSINEKLSFINENMAKKGDIDEIKAIMNEDIVKEDKILSGIKGINEQLKTLERRRIELTRQVDDTTRQLTQNIAELTHIERTIELLEADKKIIDALSHEELSTLELVKRVGYTRQYIWERLKALQSAGYVKSIRYGRRTKYCLVRIPDM